MKADLRLTPEQEKNWSAFETAEVDMWTKQTEQQIAWRNARARQQGSADLIDEMRKDADQQIDDANARKKFADAAQPLQQPRRPAKASLLRDTFPQGS